MPGIEDLMNIRTQGGTQNVPMPPPGMPPQGGAPMGPPPQAGPPIGPSMPPMGGPADMVGGPPTGGPPTGGPPMPPDMGGGEQAPLSIEEDAASLAEAVIGRAGGDPQAAVALLDTAAQMIMQSTQEEPMMAAGGGYMKKPRYAFAGEYLGEENDTLRQLIMDSMVEDKSSEVQAMRDMIGMQVGRTLTQKDIDFIREMEETPREEKFWEAYQADPDAFSKDALEAEAVEEERRKAAQRAAAYRSR